MTGGGSSSTGNYPGTASMTSADSDSPDHRLHKHSHRYYDDDDQEHRPRDRSVLFVEDKHNTIDEDEDNDGKKDGSTTSDNTPAAVAKRGLSLDDLLNTPKKVFSKTRDTQSYYQMESYKKSQSHEMSEDVYAFIVAAPVCSWSFLFALYVIGTKYIVYGTLISDVVDYHDVGGSNPAALAAKFFLIPVRFSCIFIAIAADRTVDGRRLETPRRTHPPYFSLFLLLLLSLCSVTIYSRSPLRCNQI